jgi:pre-mRNA-processing factor 17
MSLIQDYSSGEDEGAVLSTKDAFGLTSLPVTKKNRVEGAATIMVTQAAPAVLSEVSLHSSTLRWVFI